jgi:hypothetical protein
MKTVPAPPQGQRPRCANHTLPVIRELWRDRHWLRDPHHGPLQYPSACYFRSTRARCLLQEAHAGDTSSAEVSSIFGDRRRPTAPNGAPHEQQAPGPATRPHGRRLRDPPHGPPQHPSACYSLSTRARCLHPEAHAGHTSSAEVSSIFGAQRRSTRGAGSRPCNARLHRRRLLDPLQGPPQYPSACYLLSTRTRCLHPEAHAGRISSAEMLSTTPICGNEPAPAPHPEGAEGVSNGTRRTPPGTGGHPARSRTANDRDLRGPPAQPRTRAAGSRPCNGGLHLYGVGPHMRPRRDNVIGNLRRSKWSVPAEDRFDPRQ